MALLLKASWWNSCRGVYPWYSWRETIHPQQILSLTTGIQFLCLEQVVLSLEQVVLMGFVGNFHVSSMQQHLPKRAQTLQGSAKKPTDIGLSILSCTKSCPDHCTQQSPILGGSARMEMLVRDQVVRIVSEHLKQWLRVSNTCIGWPRSHFWVQGNFCKFLHAHGTHLVISSHFQGAQFRPLVLEPWDCQVSGFFSFPLCGQVSLVRIVRLDRTSLHERWGAARWRNLNGILSTSLEPESAEFFSGWLSLFNAQFWGDRRAIFIDPILNQYWTKVLSFRLYSTYIRGMVVEWCGGLHSPSSFPRTVEPCGTRWAEVRISVPGIHHAMFRIPVPYVPLISGNLEHWRLPIIDSSTTVIGKPVGNAVNSGHSWCFPLKTDIWTHSEITMACCIDVAVGLEPHFFHTKCQLM